MRSRYYYCYLTMHIIILYYLNMRKHYTKAESNQTKSNNYVYHGRSSEDNTQKENNFNVIKFVKSHYKETTINKCINQPQAR